MSLKGWDRLGSQWRQPLGDLPDSRSRQKATDGSAFPRPWR